MPSEHVIIAEELTKRFGHFTAVDRISFSVKRGEIFGFLGSNGAGKTTAMKMLCGLLRPSAGRAIVAGHSVNHQAERVKRRIGYMMQRFSLYEDLRVCENIRLYGGIYGMRSQVIRQQMRLLLERLDFTKYRDTLVRELPLGLKQRLAFSVAIFHRPEVVFLDEPTGGVDPIMRRRFWELIYEAAEEGITVFVTTHYMDEAEYCNRISMMVDGQIRAMGAPAHLKQLYGVGSMDDVFRHLARGGGRE